MKVSPCLWKALVKFSWLVKGYAFLWFFKVPERENSNWKKSAFQLAEERRKNRGFGLSDGWTVGPVSANSKYIYPCECHPEMAQVRLCISDLIVLNMKHSQNSPRISRSASMLCFCLKGLRLILKPSNVMTDSFSIREWLFDSCPFSTRTSFLKFVLFQAVGISRLSRQNVIVGTSRSERGSWSTLKVVIPLM